MLRTKVVKSMLGLSAVAALFVAVAVHAQSGGSAAGAQPTTGQGTTGQTGANTGANTGATGTVVNQGGAHNSTQSGTQKGTQSATQSATQSGGQSGAQAGMQGGQGGTTASGTGTGKLSRSDQKMIMSMAQYDLAEIEMARMAQSKSQNEQVKNFAQQMIDDHTKAMAEVQVVAQAKGITLPTELDRTHRAKADKLGALSGDAFDRAYMAQAGVADHKKNHSMLRSAQSKAKDPDVKALAARTLPIVDQHLNSAQQVHKSTAQGRSGTQGTTGSSPDKR